ncbi:phage tail protein [Streptomyces sp. NPDC001889]
MALNVGELVAGLRADDSGWRTGLAAAQLRMRGLTRDAETRLSALRRLFVSEGDAAGRGLADGIREHSEAAMAAVKKVGPAVGGISVGLPAVAAATTALGGLAAGAVAAGIAVRAFSLAAGPQLEEVANVAELAAAAEEAVAAGAEDAAEKQQAYRDALAELPPATREAAREFIALKAGHREWSDEMSGTTMPVFTKGMQVLRSLLPQVTPFVEAAGHVFGDTLDRIAVGVRSARFREWATDTAAASGPALSNLITFLGNMGQGFRSLLQAFLPTSAGVTSGLVSMSDAFEDWAAGLKGSEGFADFLDFAGDGADTLGALGGAAVQVLVALGPLIGVGTQLLLIFASIVSAVPTPVLTALAAVIATTAVGMRLYAVGAAIVATANTVMASSAWAAIAGWTRMMAVGLMAYVRIGAAALASATATAAAWMGSALLSIGTWVAAVVRAALVSTAQFALMAARAVAWAAVMAAQWLIAMGPVGWVIAAVVGLVAAIVLNWDNIKKYTKAAWDWLWGKIKGIAQGLWDFFLNWTIAGLFIKHWSAIKEGTIRKALEMVAWVAGLPGRISNAVGSLSRLLAGAGRDVVAGLWSGIQGMGGWLRGKLMSWARSVIPGPIAQALGISSPSKVTKAQGRWIARGLADGMTGSSKQVKAASRRLADIVRDSLKGGREKRALSRIARDSQVLSDLAKQEEHLAKRLKSASKKLADMVKARDKLAASVKQGVLDAADITRQQGDGPVTADGILTGLNDKLAAARQFAEQLATLRKKGVRGDLIAQIAEAGVEGGLGAANALANASSNQIKQINSSQSQLVKAAGSAGATAGTALYGAGIQAAQGLVRGLKAEQSAIEEQMLAIAKSMTKAIKQALGIKSPSRVLADQVGQWIPKGILQGIDAETPALDRSMAALVTPPSGPALGTGAGVRPDVLAAAGGRPIVLEIRSSGSRTDDLVLESLRHSVKVRGGDVQVVVAGKR